MGVYIPNMSKPKSCAECELWSNCFYPKAPKEIDNKVMPDCPLIEIVQCKECKWSKKEGDEGEGNLTCACHIPRFIVPSDGFCYLGERRE